MSENVWGPDFTNTGWPEMRFLLVYNQGTRPGKHTKKLLKMVIEIVDLPINNMVIFHSFLYVYQRVTSGEQIYS